MIYSSKTAGMLKFLLQNIHLKLIRVNSKIKPINNEILAINLGTLFLKLKIVSYKIFTILTTQHLNVIFLQV